MIEAVLDASAILALLQGEPGGEAIADRLPRSTVSAVNLAEVVAKLIERGVPAQDAVAAMRSLPVETAEATYDVGIAAGLLHARTRGRGVSVGDRFCLALAQETGLPVFTADRAWAELGLDLDIRLIR